MWEEIPPKELKPLQLEAANPFDELQQLNIDITGKMLYRKIAPVIPEKSATA